MSDEFRELAKQIISEANTPHDDQTLYYDSLASRMLAAFKAQCYPERLFWRAIRIAVVVLVNEARNNTREEIKRNLVYKEEAEPQTSADDSKIITPSLAAAKRASSLPPPVKELVPRVSPNERGLRILNEWIVDGRVILGDCTTFELRSEADKARRIAGAYLHRADFYDEVARAALSNKLVRESIIVAEIDEIFQKHLGKFDPNAQASSPE